MNSLLLCNARFSRRISEARTTQISSLLLQLLIDWLPDNEGIGDTSEQESGRGRVEDKVSTAYRFLFSSVSTNLSAWRCAGAPLEARKVKMLLPRATTAGDIALSLSNMVFHCLASSGAGACSSAGVVEKDCEYVLPQKKAVAVSPRT